MENAEIGIVIEDSGTCISEQKSCIFNELGGFIGSDEQNSFYVQNELRQVQSKHIKISYEEGFFTIAPVDDAVVFYDDSFSKMQGGYDTIVNVGDTFKIADMKFRFTKVKDIEKLLKDNKKELKDIQKDDTLDKLVLKPRGQINIEFNEKKDMKKIIEAKSDFSFIEEKVDTSFLKQEKDPLALNYENIIKSLEKSLKELKMEQKSAKFDEDYTSFNIKELENIIANISLVKSTKLINTILLSLVAKELYSPIFEELPENMFMKYLSMAIQNNIKEDKVFFENLVIKALQNYMKK